MLRAFDGCLGSIRALSFHHRLVRRGWMTWRREGTRAKETEQFACWNNGNKCNNENEKPLIPGYPGQRTHQERQVLHIKEGSCLKSRDIVQSKGRSTTVGLEKQKNKDKKVEKCFPRLNILSKTSFHGSMSKLPFFNIAI